MDGRYTLQAKKEAYKIFNIIKIHKKNPKKILGKIKEKLTIGFDPKIYSEFNLKINFQSENTTLIPLKENLVDKI